MRPFLRPRIVTQFLDLGFQWLIEAFESLFLDVHRLSPEALAAMNHALAAVFRVVHYPPTDHPPPAPFRGAGGAGNATGGPRGAFEA
jgi:hypothetical protein